MNRTNAPLAIASLFLSLALWLYVFPQHLADEDSRLVSVKLSASGLPNRMVVTNILDRVVLTAKGDAKTLNEITNDPQLEAVVALAGATPGRLKYPVTVTPARYGEYFPGGHTATVEIEEIASRKIPIEVETQGQIDDPTLALEDTLVDPQTVTVSGPKSVIDRVAKARVIFDLRPITLTAKEAQNPAIEAVFSNGAAADNVELDPKIARVTPIISASPQQKQVSVVPLLSGSSPQGFVMAGYEVSPSLVTIRGSSRALAGITTLSTEPVDISAITKTTELTVDLRVPKGILTMPVRKVKVKVMVNPAPATSGQ